MAGNKIGGLKASATNKLRHGEDFYKRIGAKGGIAPNATPKGFAANRELASRVGKIGGQTSSRKGVKNGQGKFSK